VAEHSELTGLGLTRARAAAIQALARAFDEGRLKLDANTDPEAAIERLQTLPGIGDWTAHYIGMRALRWPDAFPHGDLGIRKVLGMTSSRHILIAADAWRPWRAYAAMYLWNHLGKLSMKGPNV
jgi:AraC family transcriptional regulator of adaptative response / DNA-3-methyladenine glycosylase II